MGEKTEGLSTEPRAFHLNPRDRPTRILIIVEAEQPATRRRSSERLKSHSTVQTCE